MQSSKKAAGRNYQKIKLFWGLGVIIKPDLKPAKRALSNDGSVD